MERFKPDGFLEWLLRPLLMADPSAFMYVEFMAPDLRLAMFGLLLAIGMCFRNRTGKFNQVQYRLIIAFWLALYLWTFVVGNGRYFMAGLLLLGPLMVVAWRRLPGTTEFRWLILVAMAGLHAAVLLTTYRPDGWGRASWAVGPGADIEESGLLRQPAVFVTASMNAYSILVPRFHPSSRWAHLIGPYDLRPPSREYALAVKALRSDLPKYMVLSNAGSATGAPAQPSAEAIKTLALSLAVYGLVMQPKPCVMLKSGLAMASGVTEISTAGIKTEPVRGFWFCSLVYSDAARLAATDRRVPESALSDVFEAIEHRCPRFFPPNGGITREFDGMTSRWYPGVDIMISITTSGEVRYKYFRAMNHRYIGLVRDVRDGMFSLNCDKPDGRYVAPWNND